MPAVSPTSDLLESLKSEIGIADEAVGHVIELTPHLALAVALLYMIASDGEIEDQESSQLQSVLGGDKEVLRYGLSYVQSVSIEQFLADVPEVLDQKDCLCILTNVCDSLLSDGHADDAELGLFYRMVTAFGLTEKTFEPYFKTIALKNDKTVLGLFNGAPDEVLAISPHHALAISLLYMMTADGAIGTEEIGQLEAVIGEFEGLQKVALKYVRQTKVKQFLDDAAPVLTAQQKLYILTNVCDSMLSDGNVALLENKLFQTILTSFGYNDASFASYYQTIEIKNVKPFDTSEFKPKITHRRLKNSGRDEDGVTFDKKLSPLDKGYQAPADAYSTAANQEVWSDGVSAVSMGTLIQRTMNDNIDHVAQDFETNANIVKVGHNATDDLNIQKVGQGLGPDNVQQVEEAAQAAENRQAIDATAEVANRQTLATTSALANHQVVALTAVERNLQAIDSDRMNNHREVVPVEARMQNLYEGIDNLNQRLNRFEKENKDFLDAIRAEMLIDVAGVVVNVSPEEQELIDMVDEMLRIDNVQDLAVTHVDPNLQQQPFADAQVNLQPVPFDDVPVNVQQIAFSDASDNVQPIPVVDVQDNIQTIGLSATAPNYQLIRQEKTLNLSAIATQAMAATDDAVNAAQGTSTQHEEVAFAQADDGTTKTDPTQAEQARSTSGVSTTTTTTTAADKHARHHVGMGRYTPMGLHWFYTHAKVVFVFALCVFAMPMNSKLPISRMAAGFLITADSSSDPADRLQEQKFELVKLDAQD